MKRLAGNLLMGLGILGAVLTLIWITGGIVTMPRDANEDQRTMRNAGILIAGAMLAVEVVLVLAGRFLRRSETRERAPRVKHPPRRRWLLIPYLLGSLGIGALAALLPRSVWQQLGPLGLLICQPYILVQFIGGGLLGLKLSGGGLTHVVTVTANLVYFPTLLYPLYRILTIDRNAQTQAYALMRITLGLFLGAHILVALFLLIASQA